MWKHYQVREVQDQVYSWENISRFMYWYYKLTGKKEVRVDVYYQCSPRR